MFSILPLHYPDGGILGLTKQNGIYCQVITVESSALVALVAGANTTVRGGEDAILDLTATVDPDEVGYMKCSRHVYIR